MSWTSLRYGHVTQSCFRLFRICAKHNFLQLTFYHPARSSSTSFHNPLAIFYYFQYIHLNCRHSNNIIILVRARLLTQLVVAWWGNSSLLQKAARSWIQLLDSSQGVTWRWSSIQNTCNIIIKCLFYFSASKVQNSLHASIPYQANTACAYIIHA